MADTPDIEDKDVTTTKIDVSDDTDNETTPAEPTAGAEEKPVEKPVRSHKLKTFLMSLVASKKRIAILTVVSLLVLGCGGYGIFTVLRKKPNQPVAQSEVGVTVETPADVEVPPPATTDFVIKEAVTLSDNTYFDSPKAMGDLKLFKEEEAMPDAEKPAEDAGPAYSYFEIGKTKDGQQIIVAVANYGLGESHDFFLGKAGKYKMMVHMNSYLLEAARSSDTAKREPLAWFEKSLTENTTLDPASRLAELDFPTELEMGGQKVKSQTYLEFLKEGTTTLNTMNDKKTVVSLGNNGGKAFYRTVKDASEANSNYQVGSLYATFKNLFRMSYTMNGELTKNSSDALKINWTSGDKNSSVYYSGGPGCGGGSTYVIASESIRNKLTQVGASPAGQKIYQLPVDDALVKELYEKDYNKGEFLEKQEFKNMTIQQFSEKHGYFIVENGYKQLVVLQRDEFFMRGGCAKPVIYLYPTKPTVVSVSVGADVTLSDPLYPSGGWKNVIARPDGKLSYQGKPYDSLFWEGYGHGVYPEITSGTIVRSDQAVSTIRSQLVQQGLQGREIDDFVEFWTPKLPKTPYVRLTWFGTNELNRLAALQVSPQPHTSIRVFLDFEGLEKPYALAPQKLTTTKRAGFTLIEWGGLARDGSVPKLR